MSLPAYAQLQNSNWNFSFKNSLSFTGAGASTTSSQLVSLEGASSISTSSGSLLFYTDGITVWNKQHQVINNGTGLAGGTGSSTQAALIIPVGTEERWYYIFTTDEQGRPKGLNYSVVDMTADNGNGAVVTKNIQLVTPVSEKLSAVRHCNKKDFWVLTHQLGTNTFYAYVVSENGVSPAVISSTGPPIAATSAAAAGEMKFSWDGKKIAMAAGKDGVFLYNFNNATGVVSNGAAIYGNTASPYGVCFSPSSRFLYVGLLISIEPGFSVVTKLVQYDVSLPSTAAIINSMYELIRKPSTVHFGSLQLGMDMKIYMPVLPGRDMAAITQPDQAGAACNFVADAIRFPEQLFWSLPNFPADPFGPNHEIKILTQNPCISVPVNFSVDLADPATPVLWDFGDPASSQNQATTPTAAHQYTRGGTYEVRLVVYGPCENDTVYETINVTDKLADIGPDRNFCENSPVTLDIGGLAIHSYTWNNGTLGPSMTTNIPGWHWVDVRDEQGCISRDSIHLTMIPLPVVSLPASLTLCEGSSVILDAGNPGATFLWNNNSTLQTLTVTQPGVYKVKVTANDCSNETSVMIGGKKAPVFSLGPDQDICGATPVVLDPGIIEGVFLWQDGSSSTTYTTTTEGKYYLRVTNECGNRSDTVLLKRGPCEVLIPSGFTPDGNGLNDQFMIGGAYLINKMTLRIYDRAGQLVFSTNDKSKGWDGRYKGQPVPAGVYVYQLSYSLTSDERTINTKGTITLIR